MRSTGQPPRPGTLDQLLAGDPPTVARGLLGWTITGGGVTARLTETEAYGGAGDDPASHAFRGRTERSAVMFGEPGLVYVYFVFGMHWCVNIVCGAPGTAAAVLLRAGAVISGHGLARQRRVAVRSRGASARRPVGRLAGRPLPDRDLARGPARLATVLGVDGSANGSSLLDGTGPLALSPPEAGEPPGGTTAAPGALAIRCGPRVGVAAAREVPWRFWIDEEPSVSAYRARRTG